MKNNNKTEIYEIIQTDWGLLDDQYDALDEYEEQYINNKEFYVEEY